MKFKFMINQEIRKIMAFFYVVHFPVLAFYKSLSLLSLGRRRTIGTSYPFLALWLDSISPSGLYPE